MANKMMMNKKGDGGATSLWPKIIAAGLVIILLVIAIPNMFGQGFTSIESNFCLGVDTDEDGVSDLQERTTGSCICNDDIPSKQFYVIDTDFVEDTTKHKAQELFAGDLPSRISYEDVTRISKYIYEKEAYKAQGGNGPNAPVLVLKDSDIQTKKPSPNLNEFCFTKTSDCTIEDFKEDFFVHESTYTFVTECLVENDGDDCKKLREERCAEEKAKAKESERQERQAQS